MAVEDYKSKAVARFMEKVGAPDANGCWLWTASQFRNGYGTFSFKGKNLQSHRASFALFVSEIPEGMFVCHHCDVPLCVNPSHLFIGTRSDNVQDSIKKGRAARLYGEKNGASKLTNDDVLAIRRDYKSGEYTYLTLADRYKIGETTICEILMGRRWQHV